MERQLWSPAALQLVHHMAAPESNALPRSSTQEVVEVQQLMVLPATEEMAVSVAEEEAEEVDKPEAKVVTVATVS